MEVRRSLFELWRYRCKLAVLEPQCRVRGILERGLYAGGCLLNIWSPFVGSGESVVS